MKTKYLILSALVIGMMVGATSCKKTKITPTSGGGNQGSSIAEKTKTEDELNVKTMVETMVFGEQTPNYYSTAVLNRIENRVTTFNDSTTKAIIIFNSYVPSLTEQDYTNIYICYKNGGNIVICSPSQHNFSAIFRNGILNAAFKEDVLKYNTVGFDREKWMEYVGKRLFTINCETPLSEGVLAASVGFHKGHKYLLNNLTEGTHVAQITNYQYGIMADGVVQWINDTQCDEKLTFKSLMGKGNDLTDLTTAEISTMVCVVHVDYPASYGGNVEFKDNYFSLRNTLTVYAAYSFDDNRDWYQVDQNITYSNGDMSPCVDINNNSCWWSRSNYCYVKSLGAFTAKLHMTLPQGTTHVYSSHPETTNGSYSSSYETSQGTATSITNGGSIGFNLGFSGSDFDLGFSGSYEHAVTTEESFSTTTGTSCDVSDISVTKSTVNEDGYDKLKWDYTVKTPYAYETTYEAKGSGESTTTYHEPHWWNANLAMTDCDQQNSAIYYVDNPSGEATIHCDNWCKCYMTVFNYDGWAANLGSGIANYYYLQPCECNTPVDFTVTRPMRYQEEWGFSCVDYGDITGNNAMIYMFEQAITQDIFNGVNRITDIGGADENDNTDANSLLNLFVDEIAMFADSYAARGYTGTYVFQLQSKDTGRVIQKSYTIR